MKKDFMRRLFRNRTWVLGVIFGLGGGTAAYMIAQSMIGPALTPGLMASGLIVLAIGSVRINHEISKHIRNHRHRIDDHRNPFIGFE